MSPAPRPVQDALRRYLEYSDMGPWHTMINTLEGQVEAVRLRLADTAGCDPEEMAITRNASESLEIAQMGIDLKRGDEVLTTNQDYPRMLTTFQQRELRHSEVPAKAVKLTRNAGHVCVNSARRTPSGNLLRPGP